MARIGPKEARLRELQAQRAVPKHVDMMLADGAPLACVALPGEPKEHVIVAAPVVVAAPPQRDFRIPKGMSDKEGQAMLAAKAEEERLKRINYKRAAEGLPKIKELPTPAAKAATQENDMTTRKIKKTAAKKTRGATSARRKPATTKAPKAPKTPKVKAPRGMVVEILKLASHASGASRADLDALTKWKGAPWKWLFSNPKKNGYCDRFGYSFEVIEGKEGETRYKVVKLPEKAAA